jgi:hypothetical protein
MSEGADGPSASRAFLQSSGARKSTLKNHKSHEPPSTTRLENAATMGGGGSDDSGGYPGGAAGVVGATPANGGLKASRFGASTTSPLPTSQLLVELKKALLKHNVTFKQSQSGPKLTCEFRTASTPKGPQLQRRRVTMQNLVTWEMEVCPVPKMDLRGIILRRIAGNQWRYKQIVTAVMSVVIRQGGKVKSL